LGLGVVVVLLVVVAVVLRRDDWCDGRGKRRPAGHLGRIISLRLLLVTVAGELMIYSRIVAAKG